MCEKPSPLEFLLSDIGETLSNIQKYRTLLNIAQGCFAEKANLFKNYAPEAYTELAYVLGFYEPETETIDVEFEVSGTRIGTDFWNA